MNVWRLCPSGFGRSRMLGSAVAIAMVASALPSQAQVLNPQPTSFTIYSTPSQGTVIEQGGSSFSFGFGSSRVRSGSYVYVGPNPSRRPTRIEINNSTLVNPTFINGVPYYPGYSYSPFYREYVTVETYTRPSPRIVVDPQYGVRFQDPEY